MIVIADTRFAASQPGGFEWYVMLLLRELALHHPDYRIVILVTEKGESGNTGGNFARLVTGRLPSSVSGRWWWERVSLPKLLRREQASIYISCNGLLCRKTPVPQLLLSPGPGNEDTRKSGSARLNLPPRHWMTVTESGREQWTEFAPRLREGLVSGIAVRPAFQPLPWEEKIKVKEQYTAGTEYFLYAGSFRPGKNLVNLLKAFSLFKKRQQSNWKLVLAGVAEEGYTVFEQALKTYKYRSDVILTGYLEEPALARLTASAYGVVYPFLYEEVAMPVAEALQSGVPVIAAPDTAAKEIAGEAALYANPEEPASIADQMMRLYKDERLRLQLINAGLEKAAGFSITEAAGRLAAMIEEAVPRN